MPRKPLTLDAARAAQARLKDARDACGHLATSTERFEIAREIVRLLDAEHCVWLYTELEGLIPPSSSRESSMKTPQKPQKTASKMRSKHATREPTLSSQYKAFVDSHRDGVRTMDVARQFGLPIPNVHKTLMLLLKQGRIHSKGKRNARLWFPTDGAPVERVTSINSAIVHVLQNAAVAVDSKLIVESVIALLARTTKQRPQSGSITTALCRLSDAGKIVKDGLNENGALYRLAEEKGESTDPNPSLN